MAEALKKFDVWIADLNPRMGTEPGKTRPVIVVQTDLLNNIHPLTVICPISTNVQSGSEILRIHLSVKEAGLKTRSDILVDQLRAIDNKRLIRKIGRISRSHASKLIENLKIILDLDTE